MQGSLLYLLHSVFRKALDKIPNSSASGEAAGISIFALLVVFDVY